MALLIVPIDGCGRYSSDHVVQMHWRVWDKQSLIYGGFFFLFFFFCLLCISQSTCVSESHDLDSPVELGRGMLGI